MKQKAEVRHPALWSRVGAHWQMTAEYNRVWWQFKEGRISRATFFRKKAALRLAYDAEG